ncbi:arginine--tRNA ligase [bacterium]|nr:arginine--tRNA ligase [bacterium]|tara:strand:- start:3018 stop:4700 length:1683 start_codon:yes stop_codon:yes gene_type:complete
MQQIRDAIANALTELNLPSVDFSVEHPADVTHGDYATNVAMVLAKQVGEAPRQVAEQLVAALAGRIEIVEAISIAGPGFINFTLTREFFTNTTKQVIEAGGEWGTHDAWAGKTVLVEYTDPNPFKDFHVGHLFTNTVGESIARLFMTAGANTKRCNYQGDVGMHVANAIWGMQQLGIAAAGEMSAADLGRAYAHGATAYKEGDSAVVSEIKHINKAVYERSDDTINALYDKGRAVSLEYFETIYALVGTAFDYYFFESEAGPKGLALVAENPEVFVESDGARVFPGEQYGLHTRVFVNSEGLPTYEAKELALAKMKEDAAGTYDHSVISTAKEINEYFKVLLCAMDKVYPELAAKTEHIGHGMVRLASGKMSSRTGEVIQALDFITDIKTAALAKMVETGSEADEATATQVAMAAIKYATLKGNILQDSVFDKATALSFEGDSGPYLQYTNARINSVLEKAAAADVAPRVEHAPAEPYALEQLLYRWPEVTQAALAERAPHLVARYLTDLAGAFNTFYAQEKIADATDEHAPYKAALAQAVGQTLQNGLWVLGIEAPQRM